MKNASISSAKNGLSALIDRVRRGETIIITDRNRPVAQLSPLAPDLSTDSARITEMERSGLIKRGRPGPSKGLLQRLPPMPTTTANVLRALLLDRDEGR